MSDLVDLSERVTATYYDDEHEEWSQKTVTIADVLDSVCDDYTVLPSVQPEPCEDAVSKEAISEWLKQYGQDVLHGKHKFSLMYIWKNLMDLPSAQPEIIRCKDCRHYVAEDCNCLQMDTGGWMYYPDDFCSLAERRENATF